MRCCQRHAAASCSSHSSLLACSIQSGCSVPTSRSVRLQHQQVTCSQNSRASMTAASTSLAKLCSPAVPICAIQAVQSSAATGGIRTVTKPSSSDSSTVMTATVHAHIGSRVQRCTCAPHCSHSAAEQSSVDLQGLVELPYLLSMDGKEHNYVTSHIPGPGMRVEDMFASFDSDNFEAVMRTKGSIEADHQAAAASLAAQLAVESGAGSSVASWKADSLYKLVMRTRAAGLAAEQQAKGRLARTKCSTAVQCTE